MTIFLASPPSVPPEQGRGPSLSWLWFQRYSWLVESRNCVSSYKPKEDMFHAEDVTIIKGADKYLLQKSMKEWGGQLNFPKGSHMNLVWKVFFARWHCFHRGPERTMWWNVVNQADCSLQEYSCWTRHHLCLKCDGFCFVLFYVYVCLVSAVCVWCCHFHFYIAYRSESLFYGSCAPSVLHTCIVLSI